MRRHVWLAWAALAAACARSGPAPVVPAAVPSGERPDQPVASSAPSAPPPASCCAADSLRPDPAQAPTSAVNLPRSPADPPPPISPREEPFLDSLRLAAADTSAPVTVRVGRDAVRAEAEALFGRPEGLAGAATWDIDVVTYASHERVQYWMNFFTGRSRWHFERYLERVGRYDSMIRARLAAAGLPQDLIYLAMIESGFNQNARSRAGAVGLWQFIPETARRYGLIVDSWVDDRRDPYLSTAAAVRFLSELNDRFGSLYLAAAAYNGGPGKIQRGLRTQDFGALPGDAQFFALADGGFLRRETRDYVPKLIAAALLAKEPERYGFTGLERWSPLGYDSVELNLAVGLDVLARVSGTSREVIEELNARFYRGVTPPDRAVWVRVPPGAADSVAARVANLPPADRVTVMVHVISRGETLSRIARQYGVSTTEIRGANRGMGQVLRIGQRLVIPGAVMPASGVRRSRTSPARTWNTAMAGGTSRVRTAGSVATRGATYGASRARRVHIVRQGETLWEIARDFGVPVERVMDANDLTRRSVLQPGQRIVIPD